MITWVRMMELDNDKEEFGDGVDIAMKDVSKIIRKVLRILTAGWMVISFLGKEVFWCKSVSLILDMINLICL